MKQIYQVSRVLCNESLTPIEILIIDSIEFKKHKQTKLIEYIRRYKQLNLSMELLRENWAEIAELNNDSSSLRSCQLRNGPVIGLAKFNEKRQAGITTKEDYVERYGKAEAAARLRSRAASEEIYIERHGVELGKEKWNNYLQKRKSSYAKKKASGHVYSKYNRNYFHLLYGVANGDEIYDRKIEGQRFKVSLAGYIEKYGPIDGPIMCKICKDHTSITYFTTKYGHDEGTIKYQERCAISVGNFRTASKWSLLVIGKIKQEIDDLFYYGDNELTIAVKDYPLLGQKIIKPDLFYKGCIIEFQGDIFHANPLLFEYNTTPHPYNKTITAGEIWAIDAIRIDYYKSKQYNTLEVWESEWNNNKESTIAKCVNFLKKHLNGTK